MGFCSAKTKKNKNPFFYKFYSGFPFSRWPQKLVCMIDTGYQYMFCIVFRQLSFSAFQESCPIFEAHLLLCFRSGTLPRVTDSQLREGTGSAPSSLTPSTRQLPVAHVCADHPALECGLVQRNSFLANA
jgi:hypothetical protein